MNFDSLILILLIINIAYLVFAIWNDTEEYIRTVTYVSVISAIVLLLLVLTKPVNDITEKVHVISNKGIVVVKNQIVDVGKKTNKMYQDGEEIRIRCHGGSNGYINFPYIFEILDNEDNREK